MKPARNMTNGSFSINICDLPIQCQPKQNCLHQSLPDELGIGQSAIFQLDQDLSYIDTRYTPSNNLAILSKIENQEPRLVVTLDLKGNSRFVSRGGDEIFFNEGYTTITSFNSSIGERQYLANETVTQLRLSIGKQWLTKYFGENKSAHLFDKKETQLISHRPISAEGLTSARHLTANNVSEELKLLFIHAQAMTILTTELAHLFGNKDQYNQRDKSIAELARDILFSEFKNPPSIAELSKRAGTNEFKLKTLFHQFFNNTPYGLLFEFRMNKAYQLLATTNVQVASVSDSVGYNHASNFTAAFTKHFGIPPKAVAKKTKSCPSRH